LQGAQGKTDKKGLAEIDLISAVKTYKFPAEYKATAYTKTLSDPDRARSRAETREAPDHFASSEPGCAEFTHETLAIR
jgi:hypothetical protein